MPRKAKDVAAPMPPSRAEAVEDLTPPPPPPEPAYNVSIRLQQGTVGGDAFVSWTALPESRVWALLRDEVTFIRLPASYNTHPGGETKFINRDQILEIHLHPAWPHAEPW